MPLAQQFAQDRQGRRFADVLNDARISFPAILAFFNDSQRQRRLIESELYHDRPALAGVICELEHRQEKKRCQVGFSLDGQGMGSLTSLA
jgi:hypothetical protein